MLLLTLASTLSTSINSWRSNGHTYRSFLRTIIVPEERLPVFPDPDDSEDYEVDVALQELLNLNQTSLDGYHDLLKTTANPELRNLIETVLRQRTAQNAELLEMLSRFDPDTGKINESDAALVDPNASELRVMWVRAVWNLEQEHFGRFADQIELAESMLEDAYLTAAEAVQHADITNLFLQHAMSVCGARQRLEEISGDFASD